MSINLIKLEKQKYDIQNNFFDFCKNEMPTCILNIILDYFSQEIKDTCADKKITDTEIIIEFDHQWMIELINIFDEYNIFGWNAKYGHLENMKWLLKNYFYYNTDIFIEAAKNGNLNNMKWLLENKFPYNEWTFAYAAENGSLENMKWMLENKFSYNTHTFMYAVANGFHSGSNLQNLENIKWLLENKFPKNKDLDPCFRAKDASSSDAFFPYGENTKGKLIELGLLKN